MSSTKKKLLGLAVACLLVFLWYSSTRVEVVNARPSGSQIIAFGDSLTSGIGAGPGEDYPSVLSKMTGETILNRGVPGETTAEALRRLKRDVLDQDPRIVIVCLGGNDLLQRHSEEKTFANLEQIVRAIQDKGALVVLVGVQGFLFSDGYNGQFKKLARRTGSVLVPNVLRGILDNRKLKADQIHPNAEGYRIVAERIHEKLRPYLAKE